MDFHLILPSFKSSTMTSNNVTDHLSECKREHLCGFTRFLSNKMFKPSKIIDFLLPIWGCVIFSQTQATSSQNELVRSTIHEAPHLKHGHGKAKPRRSEGRTASIDLGDGKETMGTQRRLFPVRQKPLTVSCF